jgi:putative ABC transport system permease protein
VERVASKFTLQSGQHDPRSFTQKELTNAEQWLFARGHSPTAICMVRSLAAGARSLTSESLNPSESMIWNYLKIAIRSLQRHPGYSFINVTGLAVGIACCLLMLLFVRDELSYDDYHDRGDRIFRVVKGDNANTPELWAPALEVEFSEVESAARLMGGFGRALVFNGDERQPEPNGLYADATALSVFSWPLTSGNSANALALPFSIVLTESMAERYFGDDDPTGKVMRIGGISNDAATRDYSVTGVIADVPRRSHVSFDYLISFATVEALNESGRWGTPLSWTNPMAKTYLLLRSPVNAEQVASRLPDFFAHHIDDPQYTFDDARLQSIGTIHLHSNLNSEFEPGGGIIYVYLFSTLALFLLTIASINFMNLATARSEQRAGEVGVRKVLGAGRSQLIRQFIGESVVLTLVALGVAIVLLFVLLPMFNMIVGRSLSVGELVDARAILLFGGVALGVGILTGCYPALVLSSFSPARALKGATKSGRGSIRVRRVLVVFQFAVSIILMIGTATIYRQLHFLQNKDLGFDDDQVVVLRIGHSPALSSSIASVKQEILQHSGVVAATASHSIPSQFLNGFRYRKEGAPESERIALRDVSVDHDFVDAFGMELVRGRTFAADLASDSTAFILNEAAARAFDWTPDEALGQQITWDFSMGFTGPVVGVVKDFHFGSAHDAIPPIVFHISRFGSNFLAARIRPEDVSGTLARLEETWKQFEPDYPFEYFFVDQEFAQFYETEARMARAFTFGSGLAILIACLGLFGLAAFVAEQRKKEIGVRKVLGASVASVVGLLTRDFVVLVVAGFAVASPIAYMLMRRWLENFAYRVEMNAGVFLVAGALAVTIAFLTISYQSVRAALANPVKSLRYE